MKIDLYSQVALRRDVEEHGLRKGDVATLIDRVPHPSGGEDGYVLEVFSALGESLTVITVSEQDVESLQADELFSVRPYARILS